QKMPPPCKLNHKNKYSYLSLKALIGAIFPISLF
ncbi:MAG: hypothetical protein ACI9RZ_000455, partial [Sphingobacteriales bacterium]